MVDQDIDSFVDAFEQACACDGGADLTDYLPAANHPKYGEIIVEIARVDLELAWGRNEGRYVERYQSMFPDVFAHADALERVAFEEYRSRAQAGHSVTPADYQTRLSINTQDWPLLQTSPSTSSTTRGDRTLTASDDLLRESSSDSAVSPEFSVRVRRGGPEGTSVRRTLWQRLRFVSLVFTIILAYFAGLARFNPIVKVGLFLGSQSLIALNLGSLVACTALTIVLWSRSNLGMRWLRRLEIMLFGLILLELSVGLIHDLFIDRELMRPLREGDHALFHYASSWSMPFFAVIVAYGVLIPSTWRRCMMIVIPMAIVPLSIGLAAGFAEHGLTISFLQSYLLQMAIWMSIATGIAALRSTPHRNTAAGN